MIEQFATIEPAVIASDHGVSIVGYNSRAFKLSNGDIFTMNDVAVQQTFNMTIKEIQLGQKINDCFICIQKIKRKHWWQFWKPKYWGAKFMYVEKENYNEQ